MVSLCEYHLRSPLHLPNADSSSSPSVYVIYSGVSASASCVAMTETYHTVGGTHTVTRAYQSDGLSSALCMNSIGYGNGKTVAWGPINYADLYGSIPASESSSRIARCFTDPSQNAEWGNYMADPFISLPQDVSEIDPMWSTCAGIAVGAMDPPRALHPQAVMVPNTGNTPNSVPADPDQATQPAPDQTPTASPGMQVPPPIPTPTTTLSPPSNPAPATGSDSEPGNNSPPDPAEQGQSPTAKNPSANNPPANNAPANSPASNQSPANNAPVNNAPANNPPTNSPASDPAANSNSNSEGTPSNLQFGSDSQDVDPNSISPAQESQLHQALSPSPAAANPPSDPGSIPQGNNAPGSGAGAGANPSPNPQPNGNTGSPSEVANAANNQPVDIQLQPISSAIFNNPPPSTTNGQQASGPMNSNLGIDTPSNSGAGSDGTDSSPTGNGGSGNPGIGSDGSRSGDSGQINAAPGAAPGGVANEAALTRAPNGGLVVGSTTIMPGQSAAVNDHAIAVAPSHVVVDGNTYAFPAITASTASPVTLGGVAVQGVSNGGALIGDLTFAPGLQTTSAGHVISVGSGNVVVDGSTRIFPTPTLAGVPPILISGSPLQRASNVAIIIGSSTFAMGAQVTIAGHMLSIGTNNVVIDGTTNALPTPSLGSSPILIGSASMQRAPNGGLIIGSSTLAPGSQTTMAGHVISVGANNVVLDSSTYALPSTAIGVVLSSQPQVSAITLPNGAILSAGGSPVTVSGQVVSVLSNDKGAVIGGTTLTFAPTPIQSVFTVAGRTFTAAPTEFTIADTTISLNGPAITISGTVVSLGPSGLQSGSSTVPLTSAAATGLGGFIVSAFDAPVVTGSESGSNGTVSTTGIAPFTGSGARSKRDAWLVSVMLALFTMVGAMAFLS